MANSDINLKVLTLNVQGMRNKKTRQTLFRSFKNSKFDIISLQDTHLIDTNIDTIRLEWNGTFHLSQGSNVKKGNDRRHRRKERKKHCVQKVAGSIPWTVKSGQGGE